MKPNRDQLAAIAMHGILTACSSPQFVEQLKQHANNNGNTVSKEIARRSYDTADAVIAEGKKK